ncbi:MAG TPA: penicillin-binding transpeptidase domain-containing protein [Sporichthyaceae bacterium]|nr:penicillin-binding transpeptidase domain-containing protein [Sporichthyaceae bacterium]
MRTSPGSRPRGPRAVAGAAAVALVVAGCGSSGGSASGHDAVTTAATTFLHDWSTGDLTVAAGLTTDPTAAQAALEDFQNRIRPDTRTFTAGPRTGCHSGQPCNLAFTANLHIEALGPWQYQGSLGFVEQTTGSTKRWVVQWAPSVIHPQLTDTTTITRVRSLPDRAPIDDRYGRPLVTNQTVMKVGVTAGSVPDGTIDKLSDVLNLDVDGLTTRTSEAKSGQFVEAAVLRRSDYDAISDKLSKIPGVTTAEATESLAPTREFAREVLGAVATATAQSLANAGQYASPADPVGSFGLQETYQRQLAGLPSGKLLLVDKSTQKPVTTLATFDGTPGIPLHVSLDSRVQQAADDALTGTDENSSLVAIDVATGDILAVSNGPVSRAGDDRALAGQYAPGSVFKVITSEALLHNGLKSTDVVPCPSGITVNGKQFSNYDGLGSLGEVSFARDFEESCNTAFIGAAGKLGENALTDAAAKFGVRSEWDLGVNSYSGDVPPANSPEEQAADAIGQGRVLMSPLAMAVVAAAAASGTPRTPRLVLDGPPMDLPTAVPSGAPTPTSTPRPSLAPLPALENADVLRTLMIDTVRNGTARVLQMPGVEIGAKTGTAQYGSASQPGNHAWMVGFMGDVAFALIVERGDTGATTAGPLARKFLGEIKDYAQSLPKPQYP